MSGNITYWPAVKSDCGTIARLYSISSDGVAVLPDSRGQGICSEFMHLAEQQAKVKDLRKMSLIVFEQNVGAKRLYERLGYYEAGREATVPQELIHYTGDAVLMVKKL